MRINFIQCAVLFILTVGHTRADDWPQWLGPHRDSVWRETNIVDRFPTEGLPIKWKASVGLGYSGPAVAKGRVYVTDYVLESGEITNSAGSRDKLVGKERILCFDSVTGNPLWKHSYERTYKLSYPSGPRCIPTIDGNRVYTLGAEGNLLCLNARTGRSIWEKDLQEEYKTESPIWGFAAHPLVDGDLLYCVVGGQGSIVVAFDKLSGREVWRALSASNAGYCPPTIIEHVGVRQLLIWHPESLNSLNPQTGTVYWSEPIEPSYSMSIAVPRKLGNLLFVSGIGEVGALMELKGPDPDAEVLWWGEAKTAIYSCNVTPFLEDGVMYGVNCKSGALTAARLSDANASGTLSNQRRESGVKVMQQHFSSSTRIASSYSTKWGTLYLPNCPTRDTRS